MPEEAPHTASSEGVPSLPSSNSTRAPSEFDPTLRIITETEPPKPKQGINQLNSGSSFINPPENTRGEAHNDVPPPLHAQDNPQGEAQGSSDPRISGEAANGQENGYSQLQENVSTSEFSINDSNKGGQSNAATGFGGSSMGKRTSRSEKSSRSKGSTSSLSAFSDSSARPSTIRGSLSSASSQMDSHPGLDGVLPTGPCLILL